MLKTTELSDLTPRELEVNEIVRSGGKADDRNWSKSKNSKNTKSKIQIHIEAMRKPTVLTFGAEKTFNQLR